LFKEREFTPSKYPNLIDGIRSPDGLRLLSCEAMLELLLLLERLPWTRSFDELRPDKEIGDPRPTLSVVLVDLTLSIELLGEMLGIWVNGFDLFEFPILLLGDACVGVLVDAGRLFIIIGDLVLGFGEASDDILLFVPEEVLGAHLGGPVIDREVEMFGA
jgi:hypothetical protein